MIMPMCMGEYDLCPLHYFFRHILVNLNFIMVEKQIYV